MNSVGFFRLYTSSASLMMPGEWEQTRGFESRTQATENDASLIFQRKTSALGVFSLFFSAAPQKWPGLYNCAQREGC